MRFPPRERAGQRGQEVDDGLHREHRRDPAAGDHHADAAGRAGEALHEPHGREGREALASEQDRLGDTDDRLRGDRGTGREQGRGVEAPDAGEERGTAEPERGQEQHGGRRGEEPRDALGGTSRFPGASLLRHPPRDRRRQAELQEAQLSRQHRHQGVHAVHVRAQPADHDGRGHEGGGREREVDSDGGERAARQAGAAAHATAPARRRADTATATAHHTKGQATTA